MERQRDSFVDFDSLLIFFVWDLGEVNFVSLIQYGVISLEPWCQQLVQRVIGQDKPPTMMLGHVYYA